MATPSIPSDALKAFDFRGANVRALLIEDEPWWVAADVCAVLEIRNAAQAVSYLDDDEKKQVSPNLISSEVASGGRDPWIVNEPGLYSLILRSRKPQAKDFKRWVTHEVLPALRKTGTYSVTAETSRPTTVSWDQAAAIARLHYGLNVTVDDFRELLNKGGILTNTRRPHRKWEHLFWPLASRWEIHEVVLPQLIRFAAKVQRELAAAEQDLQMSLPLPLSGLMGEVPGRRPLRLSGGAS